METYTGIPEELKHSVLEKIKPTETEKKKLLEIQEELASEVKAAADKLGVSAVLVKKEHGVAAVDGLSQALTILMSLAASLTGNTRRSWKPWGMGMARKAAKLRNMLRTVMLQHPYLDCIQRL